MCLGAKGSNAGESGNNGFMRQKSTFYEDFENQAINASI